MFMTEEGRRRNRVGLCALGAAVLVAQLRRHVPVAMECLPGVCLFVDAQ